MGMSSGNGDVGGEEREAGAAESGGRGEEAEGTQLRPEVEEGAAERLQTLERELARLREELVSVKEEKMRLMGSVERLLRHLIGVAETIERVANLYSLSDESDARSLSEGLRLVSITIEKALREEGVEVIGSEGERFDPGLHEAVGFVESEQHEDGTVVSVMERGFAFRGKVLRPAKVIVAKRVSKEERKDGE